MVRLVSFGWVWKRWPAFLLVLCGLSAIAIAIARSSPPSSRSGTPAELEPGPADGALSHGVEVQVLAAAVCEGADAGSCAPTRDGVTEAPELAGGVVLPGARVRLFSEQDGHYLPWASTTTDARGTARLRARPGVFWCLVDAPGRARASQRWVQEGSQGQLRVVLAPARPLKVHVRDPAGQAIASARVLVQGTDPLPHAALTSAEGWASFDHVGEVIDSIRVSAEGYDSALVEATSRELRVQLSAPASLSVKVTDAGHAVPDADVWVAGVGFWPPRQVRTGADGVALLTGLSRGTYDLRARRGERVSPALIATTLEQGERRDVTLELEAGRLIRVRVSDGATADARPLAGAQLVLVEEGLSPFPQLARTGAAGRATLGPVPAGSAVLSVSADGFVPESGIAVPPTGHEEIRVALLRGGRLRGEVVDTEGIPVAGARLEIVGNDLRGRPIARRSGLRAVPRGFFEHSLGSAPPLVPMGELGVMGGPLPVPGMLPVGPPPSAAWASDLEGNYHLEDVPPGRVQLLVRHPEFVEALTDSVSLAPGGEARLRVVLERGAALEGRVLDARGQPVRGARVDALARHATQQRTALTGADGRFAFGALPLELELLVARPEQPRAFVLRRELELDADETREVELSLPPVRDPIVVDVAGEGARAVADARVSLLSLDPGVPLRETSHSDALGRTQFRDSLGLHALLRVQAAGFRSFEVELTEAPPHVSVALERAVTVVGRVTHVRGRQGLDGAEIVWIQGGERRRVSSDEGGQFRLVDVAPGAARVSISHPEFASLESDVSVSSTGRADRPFELPPFDLEEAGVVAGTVRDASGLPVRGARVGIGLVPAYLPAGAPLPRGLVETDAAGHFELRGVRAGRVSVSAYAAGLGRSSSTVEVAKGETSGGLDLRLDGAKLDSASGALANVAVTLGERDREGYTEVVIVDVAPGSQAERSGLSRGDVLWSVDGAAVEGMADTRRRFGGADGSDVIIEVEREGEPLTVSARREPVR